MFEPETQQGPRAIKFPLERTGPKGIGHDFNQRTAELRALVGALELQVWRNEGWEKVTIATSSVYVHRGITQSVAT